jgi:hypothetical protein
MSFLTSRDKEEILDNDLVAIQDANVNVKTKSKRKRVDKEDSGINEAGDETSKPPKKKSSGSSSSSNVTTKKKASKKKKKTVFKDLFDYQAQSKPHWKTVWNPNYIIFQAGDNKSVETIGIDIGWKHLAITGLRKDPGDDIPKIVFLCIMTTEISVAGEFTDYLDDLILHNEDFAWVKNAKRYRIEQQVGCNTKALMIASALRCCFRTISDARGVPLDVEFVHGNHKYKVGPRYSVKCKNDPLRLNRKTGIEGKADRKQMAVNDIFELLPLQGEKDAFEFCFLLKDCIDQLHDIADSYLIARWSYEPDGLTTVKNANRIKKKKREDDKAKKDEVNKAAENKKRKIDTEDQETTPKKKRATSTRKRKVDDDGKEPNTKKKKKTSTKRSLLTDEEKKAQKQNFFRKKALFSRFR